MTKESGTGTPGRSRLRARHGRSPTPFQAVMAANDEHRAMVGQRRHGRMRGAPA